MKFFSAIFFFTLVLTTLSVQAESLNEKQIETLLTSGFSSADVQAQVNQKGYSGDVDAETLQRLKKEGADADLILLLKSKGEAVPAAEPAKQNTNNAQTPTPVPSASPDLVGSWESDKMANSSNGRHAQAGFGADGTFYLRPTGYSDATLLDGTPPRDEVRGTYSGNVLSVNGTPTYKIVVSDGKMTLKGQEKTIHFLKMSDKDPTQ